MRKRRHRSGHLEECLEMGEVADGVGYGPIRRRLDLTVTSGLPGCQYCGTPRPLHYPGDCPSALSRTVLDMWKSTSRS